MRRDSYREAALNGKTYSRRDERRILDVLGRGLLKEFPNPNRVGCPGAEILKKIASHEMPLSESEKWLDHLGSCSPCYSDFSAFRAAYQRYRTRSVLAIAASILIVAILAGWALFLRQKEPLVAETATLDLRDRSPARGTEVNPDEAPLQMNRAVTQMRIVLPFGSSEGLYDIRLIASSGESLLAGSGTAKLRGDTTLLEVAVNASSAKPGKYILQVRKPKLDWTSYPIIVR